MWFLNDHDPAIGWWQDKVLTKRGDALGVTKELESENKK